MKNRKKYLGFGVALLGLVLVGALAMNSSEYLQGNFPGSGATWAVSASSPSGNMSATALDDIFVFDVTAPTTRAVKFADGTHFDFTFKSSTDDIDPYAAAGTQVVMRDSSGTPVGYGYIASNDVGENPTAAWASDYFSNSTWYPVQTSIAAGATETYTLTVDSASLLDEDAGMDDELMVSLNYKSINLTGSTLKY